MGSATSSGSARRLVLGVILGVSQPVLAANAPGAEPLPVRFSLRYSAPDGCPTSLDFQHAVESRAKHAEISDATQADVQLEVTLTPDGDQTAGGMVVVLADGSRSERRVADVSCDAAASSLAVMGALVLDARLPAPPEPAPAPAPAPAPVTPSRPIAAPPPASTAATRPVTVPAPRKATPAPGPELDIALRAHGSWESAVSRELPLGALAGGELGWSRPGVLSPAFGLNALIVLPRSISTSAGSASIRLLAARLLVCPLRLQIPLAAMLRPCAELDAGTLRAEAAPGVLNRGAGTMPWLAAGLAVRGELPLGAGLSLEVSVGGRALARHDRFYFRPGVPVHDVPPWSAGASVGLSYRLWASSGRTGRDRRRFGRTWSGLDDAHERTPPAR
jgi:hypothetical protein